MQGTIGYSTMVNQKQKGQSDGSDSDWTLCRTNLLLDICSFYPGFSLEVVFQFLNGKISIFSWFGVHNPLKSFSKTTQIQLIRLIQMCTILI